MIRIQLQPAGGRRFFPVLLLGFGGCLVCALALAYSTRERQPPQLIEPSAGRQSAQVPVPTPLAGPQEKPPATQAAAPPKATPKEETKPVALPIQTKAAPPAEAPPMAKGQTPAPPPASPACLRALQLVERLPATVRCTALLGAGNGEYTIEGTIPAQDFPQLVALLDGLKRLPSRATLSGGMAGRKEGDYAFNLNGQFSALPQLPGIPQDQDEAEALFGQALALARKSRLDSVRAGAPLVGAPAKGVAQERQKLWATGSYKQLKAFVETLVRQQPQLRLEEVKLVPISKGGVQWKQVQFYAVLSAVVRAR